MSHLSRLFVVVPVSEANRRFFGYLASAHGLAAIAMAAALPTRLAYSALLFTLVSWLINKWPRYRQSPFGLAFSFSTFLCFVLPLAFICFLGEQYEFGTGLLAVPADNAAYHAVAPAAVVYLILMVVISASSLVLFGPRHCPQPADLTRGLRPDVAIGGLSLIVLFFTLETTIAQLRLRVSGTETAESLWGFIFFDSAYQMLLPLIVWMRMEPANGANGRTRSFVEWQFVVILALFLLHATLGSGSKGFILTLFLLSMVFPLSYLQASQSMVCLFPSRSMFLGAAILALLLFGVAAGVRIALYSGTVTGIGDVVSAVMSSMGLESWSAALEPIAYRLSVAFDRYVLVYHAYFHQAPPLEGASEYGRYVVKSFANLVLMGTPYPEAYVPSSNLLVPVLFGEPLLGDATKAGLMRSLNTQPHTLFGVGMILVGQAAPLLVAGAFGALGWMYRLTGYVPVRLGIIYLSYTLVQAYGVEVAVANAIHLTVSLFVFVWLLRAWRWFRMKRTLTQAPSPTG